MSDQKTKADVDFLIVGGGIIGLFTAIKLKEKYPSCEIVIIEKMPFLGDHSTGRNSGVLHSSLYYETQSLKHLLCLEGLALWPSICDKFSIPYLNCGKIVFANNVSELSRLEELKIQANKNSVSIRPLSNQELLAHRNFIQILEGFLVPSTGILDVSQAIRKLSDYFETMGGIIQKSNELIEVRKSPDFFELTTEEYSFSSTHFLNCGGLWATHIREQLGLQGLTHKWVKGHYLKTNQKLNYEVLYYPTPPPDLRGLGVHSTFDLSGNVKFGPDTQDVEHVDYNMTDLNVEQMRNSIWERFKTVDIQRLSLDYSGIRSKILFESKIFKDFWVKGPSETGINGYAEACGIESPGLTSAPAIARKIVEFFT